MRNQTLIQFRADKSLKEEVSAIYESIGLDLPTAFRMFMLRSKAAKGLPFPAVMMDESEIRLSAMANFEELRTQASSVGELSVTEINAEINDTRKTKKP